MNRTAVHVRYHTSTSEGEVHQRWLRILRRTVRSGIHVLKYDCCVGIPFCVGCFALAVSFSPVLGENSLHNFRIDNIVATRPFVKFRSQQQQRISISPDFQPYDQTYSKLLANASPKRVQFRVVVTDAPIGSKAFHVIIEIVVIRNACSDFEKSLVVLNFSLLMIAKRPRVFAAARLLFDEGLLLFLELFDYVQ